MNHGRFSLSDPYASQRPSGMKTMYILRGLPGSGKSHKAKQLLRDDLDNPNRGRHGAGVIYSTDDFFMEAGEYKFDPKKIPAYHAQNQARTEAACESGITPIVIDNTNTQKWEARAYVEIARKHGYKVVFVEADAPWSKDADELAKRNVHGVPVEGIRGMLSRYEKHEDFNEENVLASKAPWET